MVDAEDSKFFFIFLKYRFKSDTSYKVVFLILSLIGKTFGFGPDVKGSSPLELV